MKIETIVLMVVMVGFVFAAVGLMVNDFQEQYPEVQINSSWQSKYDYSKEINKSASNIVGYFDKIGESEGGWIILTGIVALPLAIIEAVKIITLSLVKGTSIVTGVGTDIGINKTLLSFIIIIIIVIIVFVLIKFWRKTEYPV